MKNFFKKNLSFFILLGSIIVGGLIGVIFREKAVALKPFGQLFINLMFVILVPMIFLLICNSIVKLSSVKRMVKILVSFFVVIIVLSVVISILGYFGSTTINLINPLDKTKIESMFGENIEIGDQGSIFDKLVSLVTVSDFFMLLSKDNLIAVFVFAIIFGFSIRLGGEKTKGVAKAIDALNVVVLNMLKIIMYYAPIGLACYFAAVIGVFGNEIMLGFLRTLLAYTIVCAVVYFVLLPLIVFILKGKKGLKVWASHMLLPSITALATCSSAASMPVCIEETKKMNIDADVVETVIPLGTNFFKAGAIIGSVFKIVFLMGLFDMHFSFFGIIFISILSALLVGAVPTGGGTISEMFIISFLGFPTMALPLLTIIATIIDPFSTVTSVAGNITCSVVTDKIVATKFGKNAKTELNSEQNENNELKQETETENNEQ